jgi:hypothetical protein
VLTLPFLLTLPGFRVLEISPIDFHGEKLTGLGVCFPPDYACRSPIEQVYSDDRNLLMRHDYQLQFEGGVSASAVVSRFADVDRLMVPSVLRTYRCDTATGVLGDLLMAVEVCDVGYR